MTPIWFHRPLTGGESGHDVAVVNRKLGVPADDYGSETIAHVRGLQAAHGLEVTGVVDADVAEILGEAADHGIPPEWFYRTVRLGDTGEDVAALRRRLLSDDGEVFDDQLHRAVLRLQSARGFPLTGSVDESLALLLP